MKHPVRCTIPLLATAGTLLGGLGCSERPSIMTDSPIAIGPEVARPWTPPRKLPPPVPESTWDGLIETYDGFGLPHPAPDASLAMFHMSFLHHYPWSTVYLGFLEATNPPLILVGIERHVAEPKDLLPCNLQPILPMLGRAVAAPLHHANASLTETPEAIWATTPIHAAALATGIQLRKRGETNLSGRLLAYGLSVTNLNVSRAGDPWGDIFQASGNWSPHDWVADLAWAYWQARIEDTTTDFRPEALRQFDNIRDRHPSVVSARRAILAGRLRAMLERPPTNDIECLLVQIADERSSGGPRCPRPSRTETVLFRRGLSAVPDLMRLLDDPRLTRHRMQSVGDMASEILCRISADELKYEDMVATNRQERVNSWWQEASRAGNERYYLRHVENKVAKYALAGQCAPRLPALLREAATGRVDAVSSLVRAMDLSSLPPAVKRANLLPLADFCDLHGRHSVLLALAHLDHEAFVTNLVATLDALPEDTSNADYWTCAEAEFTHAVMMTGDPRAWEAFGRFLARAAVGLRLEAMKPLAYSYAGTNQWRPRVECLAALLDDRSVRVRSGDKYSGPCAGFEFREISVGRFAAMELGELLDLPEHPAPDWSEKQWDDFVGRVKTKLVEKQR